MFVLVQYQDRAHCNSGEYVGQEVTAAQIKEDWYLTERNDSDLLRFLENAKVGEYLIAKGGGVFIFRTR